MRTEVSPSRIPLSRNLAPNLGRRSAELRRITNLARKIADKRLSVRDIGEIFPVSESRISIFERGISISCANNFPSAERKILGGHFRAPLQLLSAKYCIF